jgi:c(7)-type cytochrome triheme protein
MFTRVGVVLVLALAIGALAVTPSAGQIKVPADFTFEQGKDSPGPVTFSHSFHKEKLDKCQACHTKIFKMKRGTSGPISMEKIKAGEACGSCHNGKTEAGGTIVFAATDKANCQRCHKK